MLFSSNAFLFVFLPLTLLAVFAASRLCGGSAAKLTLAVCSLVFYAHWRRDYLLLILASILFNYAMGHWLARLRQLNRPASGPLCCAIAANLLLLGYFKYTNFAVDSLAWLFDQQWSLAPIALPLAISFFTFQQIAYLVDAYNGSDDDAPSGLLDYALFVLFFPQLIAGPIVHHKFLTTQFAERNVFRVSAHSFALGLGIFTVGLFKKVVFADTLGTYADPVFSSVELGVEVGAAKAWGGMLAYSLQLYFDFSAYSDMAFGLAVLFNLRLPVNFYSPYKATCINTFWRQWNITLGHFFRDYLYRPLGGNRVGLAKTLRNLIIVMGLSGLWHGAGWNFVLWGLLHGLAMAVATLWGQFKQRRDWAQRLDTSRPYNALRILLTFGFVVFAWVLFRSGSLVAAQDYYALLFSGGCPLTLADFHSYADGLLSWGRQLLSGDAPELHRLFAWSNWLLLSLLIIFALPNTLQYFNISIEGNAIEQRQTFSTGQAIAVALLGALAVLTVLSSDSNEFIYFIF